ncbi:Reticulon-domain-containing protein [Gilbertella persicaria]|uniref:Reticulon-domain-containing protein n=1 Tax=Gilbertella persicaria TaxID=101096 RepID=UPI00222127A2|nr:Reticulon-domain-containing protein [Gilbertella persicaria]KAI8056309.1 Reticulon-domain-containing protein [Gilbertella persicaria]
MTTAPAIHKESNPFASGTTTTGMPSRTMGDHKRFQSTQRNDTTHRIENEVLSILQWRNPVRSGAIFAITVGSILLTRWYSLLQIGSSLLTLAIGINLVYVNLVLQSQKVLTNQDAAHPYNDVIHNDKHAMIDRQSVGYYTTVMTEVAETVIRALTRIVFIENTWTSAKWMSIFFVIWKVSAHVSTMNIILGLVMSAFIFPRLYISNKDVVDAQLQKGQTLLQTGIKQAQTAATTAVQDTYAKSRAFVAKAGTTGTDAKNTIKNESVTVKQD